MIFLVDVRSRNVLKEIVVEAFMYTQVIAQTTLALVQGNIVDAHVDAIVNAANAHLAGGGGVDGTIHRAGGPSIMAETIQKYPGGCPTGSAVASNAGKLHAQYVFHAVGPVYHGREKDAHLLASAYQACLDLAEQYQISSIAFPSLSTGVYGYPLDKAATIALKTVIAYLHKPTSLKQVQFVLFGNEAFNVFKRVLETLVES